MNSPARNEDLFVRQLISQGQLKQAMVISLTSGKYELFFECIRSVPYPDYNAAFKLAMLMKNDIAIQLLICGNVLDPSTCACISAKLGNIRMLHFFTFSGSKHIEEALLGALQGRRNDIIDWCILNGAKGGSPAFLCACKFFPEKAIAFFDSNDKGCLSQGALLLIHNPEHNYGLLNHILEIVPEITQQLFEYACSCGNGRYFSFLIKYRYRELDLQKGLYIALQKGNNIMVDIICQYSSKKDPIATASIHNTNPLAKNGTHDSPICIV